MKSKSFKKWFENHVFMLNMPPLQIWRCYIVLFQNVRLLIHHFHSNPANMNTYGCGFPLKTVISNLGISTSWWKLGKSMHETYDHLRIIQKFKVFETKSGPKCIWKHVSKESYRSKKTFDVPLSSIFHKISKCAEFFNLSSKCK